MANKLYILSVILLSVVACKTTSKSSASKEDTQSATSPACALPLVPEYPGGDEAMYQFINENLVYPEEAKKNNISGSVLVSFTVLATGEIIDIKIQQSLGYGCDEEAVRLMKLMPKWIPGKYLNKPIDMFFSLGIMFKNK